MTSTRTRPLARLTASLALLSLALSLFACARDAPPAPPPNQSQASALPSLTVKPGLRLLLTFARADGSFETVDDLTKVPEDRRGWVRVVDLGMKAESRRDHELVYVADLRQARPDGSYPHVVMSREAFEAAALGRGGGPGAAEPPRAAGGAAAEDSREPASAAPRVILYSTRWCPACRAAREHLQAKGIPFLEKDIEQDRNAGAELLAKARAAGTSTSGVPVLDVDGALLHGFDPARLESLLERSRTTK